MTEEEATERDFCSNNQPSLDSSLTSRQYIDMWTTPEVIEVIPDDDEEFYVQAVQRFLAEYDEKSRRVLLDDEKFWPILPSNEKEIQQILRHHSEKKSPRVLFFYGDEESPKDLFLKTLLRNLLDDRKVLQPACLADKELRRHTQPVRAAVSVREPQRDEAPGEVGLLGDDQSPATPPVEELNPDQVSSAPVSTQPYDHQTPPLDHLRHQLQTRFPVLYAQVLEPTLADLRQEHSATLTEGRPLTARWVLLRGCGALAAAAACQLGVSFLGRIATLWQARSPR
jgi:hypothetical protein